MRVGQLLLTAIFFSTFVHGRPETIALSPSDDWKQAVENAPPGSTVSFRPGKYSGPCNLQLTKPLFLRSESGAQETILDCGAQSQHFHILGVAVHMKDIIFVNGFAGGQGGGCVFVESGALDISGCSFVNCATDESGGAVYALNSTVSINDTQIANSFAVNDGGALFLQSANAKVSRTNFTVAESGECGGSVSLSDHSVFEANGVKFEGSSAARGAGICVSGTSVAVLRDGVEISSGTARSNGGGVFLKDGSSLDAAQAVFYNNVALSPPQTFPEDCWHVQGKDYRGAANKTVGGLPCQRWDTQSPHQHPFDPSRNNELSGNLCRNPGDGQDHVWCYTTDPNVEWDYCDVQCTCNEYCLSPVHEDYKGCVSSTVSNRTCQRWDSQFPHTHSYGNMNLEGNFCRNTGDGYPAWCYTTDPNKRYEYCDITCDGSGTPPPLSNAAALVPSGGGAIHAEGGSRVTLSGVVVEDCEASASGGGILLHESTLRAAGEVDIRNCGARLGGGISAVQGSTVHLHDQVRIEDGVAVEVGGAVHLSGSSLTASQGVTFWGFAGGRGGGCVFVESGALDISGCSFVNCATDESGGAVYAVKSTVSINDTQIANSFAVNDGGALFLQSANAKVSRTNFTVAESGECGGSVSLSDHSVFEANGVKFEGSSAARGAGICVSGTSVAVLRDGVEISSGTARSNGGGVFLKDGSSLDAAQAVFYNNVALSPPQTFPEDCWHVQGKDYRGAANKTVGGLPCQRWDTQSPHQHPFDPSRNNELSGNLCRNPGDGQDHVWCYTTDPNVEWDYCDVQCTCNEYCLSPVHEDYKGCVSSTVSGRTCQRWDSLFPHTHSYRNNNLEGNFCRNTGDGYPAWCYTTDPNTRWEYCDITCDGSGTPPPLSNAAALVPSGGGAIHAEGGSRVTLSGVVVEDCEASASGGGILLHESTLRAAGEVDIRNCGARLGGGISAVQGSTVHLHDQVRIEDGVAVEVGGAVHLSGSSLTASQGVTFWGSSAPQGGCIGAAHASSVMLTDGVEVKGCYAGDSGGAVHISVESTLEARRQVVFEDNTAGYFGGAVYVGTACSATMADGVQVRACTSQFGLGGGVSLKTPFASFEASGGVEFRGNWAASSGGAIEVDEDCTAELREVEIADNFAGRHGGGIYMFRGIVTLENSSVVNNIALERGGGLAVWWNSFCFLRHRVLVQSNSAVIGGGMYVTVATMTMEHEVIVEKCTVLEHGGGMYVRTRTDLFMSDGVVIRNCEALDGAGMWLRESPFRMERNVTITNNTAWNEGGGLRLETATTRPSYMADDVRVVGNRARNGGALYMWDHSSLQTEKGVVFQDNAASNEGGCLHVTRNSQMMFNGTVLRGCTAAFRGGAVFISGASTVAMHNSHVVAGTAEHGGGFYALSGPVLIVNSTFDGAAAVQDGGGFVATQGTVVNIRGSSFVRCRAGNYGGGSDVSGGARLVLEGANAFEHNTAQYGAGLAVRVRSELAVSGNLTVQNNEAGARGGGIFTEAVVRMEGGATLLASNRASEGGGLCAVTHAARVELHPDQQLRVANCSAQDGGGVALLESAALEFVWPDVCGRECAADQCDLACLKPECNFAHGQCTSRFEHAGPEALAACDRAQCTFQFQEFTSECFEACVVSSCDWSEDNPNCRAYLDGLRGCPLFDAAAYHSASSQPGLIYVEGGTAGGYGRCNTDGCSTRMEGNTTLSVCETIDDQGTVLAAPCENCEGEDSGVQSWGVCAERPRLPVSGWDYDEALLQAVWSMPFEEVVARFPGCGSAPLILEGNAASRFGGGLWQDSCNSVQETSEQCFVGGVDVGTPSTVLVQVRGNTADVGGGIATGCSSFGTCEPLLSRTLGIPSTAHAAPVSLSVLGNTASESGYGKDVATGPARMVVEHPDTAPHVPGQSMLDFGVTLLDSRDQVIRATRMELDYLIAVLVCPVVGPCSQSSALQPAVFLPYTSGPVEAAASEVLLQACDTAADAVVLELSLVREQLAAIGGLNQRVLVPCAPCAAGQTTQTSEAKGVQLRTCVTCAPSQYCVGPTNPLYSCETCPRGALCASGECLLRNWPRTNATCVSGETLVGEWHLDAATGTIVLDSCPGGHEREAPSFAVSAFAVSAGQDGALAASVMRCRPCTPGLEYVVNPNTQGCQPCPASCECDGIALTDPVAGAVWTPNLATGVYELQSCPPGFSRQVLKSLGGSFVATEQQCLRCTPGLQYIVRPNTDRCQDCAQGARCDGSRLEGLVEDSVWEANDEGVMVLKHCPAGFQRNSLAEGFAATAQECVKCTPGLQFILNPNTDRCQNCPVGLRCHGDATLDPALNDSRWVRDGAIFRLESCPAGTQLVNSRDGPSGPEFVAELQDCRSCRPKEYIVDPGADQCRPCPLGGSCESGIFSPLIPGSEWRPVNGAMRVFGCPSGFILLAAPSAVQDTCYPCPEGTYQTRPASIEPHWLVANDIDDAISQCHRCPPGSRCPGGDVVEPQRGYWALPSDGSSGSRRLGQAQDGFADADADGWTSPPNSTLGLRREAGADQASQGVVNVFRCNPNTCLQGGMCRQGFEGPVCGRCEEGYGRLYAGQCHKCPPRTQIPWIATLAALVICALYAAVAVYPVWKALHPDARQSRDANSSNSNSLDGSSSGQGESLEFQVAPVVQPGAAAASAQGSSANGSLQLSPRRQTVAEPVPAVPANMSGENAEEQQGMPRRSEIFGVVKILVASLQIYGSFAFLFNLDLGDMVQRSMLRMSFIQVDLFSIYGLHCATATEHLTKLFIMVAVFFSALLLLALPAFSSRFFLGRWEAGVTKVLLPTLLGWMLIASPVVARQCLSTFNCHKLGEDSWLRADYKTKCPWDDDRTSVTVWFSALCVALFPVGVPALCLCLLLYYRVPSTAFSKEVRAFLIPMAELARSLSAEKDGGIGVDKSGSQKSKDRKSGSGIVRNHESSKSWTPKQDKGRVSKQTHSRADEFDGEDDGAVRRILWTLLDHSGWNPEVWDLDNMTGRTLRLCAMRVGANLERAHLLQRLPIRWNPQESEHEDLLLTRIGPMLRLYRVPCWYHEAIEMSRRIIMMSALVLLYPNREGLVVVALMISGFFLLYSLFYRPYASALLQITSIQALLTECVLLFGTVVRQQYGDEENDNSNLSYTWDVLSVSMVMLTVATPVLYMALRRLFFTPTATVLMAAILNIWT